MIRKLALSTLVALIALAYVIPSASFAQDARPPIEIVTDLPPVPADQFNPTPAPAATPAAEESDTDIVSWFAGAIGRALADGLYYALGIAGAWLMGMMGFKEWNAAKVQEALRDEKMKPYAEGVIRFVVDWLTRMLKRQPKVSEVLDWITRQFPEVRNWIGRTDKERGEFIETFLDAPPTMSLMAASGSGSAAAARPAKKRPVPKPVAKVDPLKGTGAPPPATPA